MESEAAVVNASQNRNQAEADIASLQRELSLDACFGF